MLHLLSKQERHAYYKNSHSFVALLPKLDTAPTMYYAEGYERMVAWDTTCVQCAVQIAIWMKEWARTTELYIAASTRQNEAILYCEKSKAPGKEKGSEVVEVHQTQENYFGYNDV